MLCAAVVGEKDYQRVLRKMQPGEGVQQASNIVIEARQAGQVILAHVFAGNDAKLRVLVVVVDVLGPIVLGIVFRDRLQAESPQVAFRNFMHQTVNGVVRHIEENGSRMPFEKLDSAIRKEVCQVATFKTFAAPVFEQRPQRRAMAVWIRRRVLDIFREKGRKWWACDEKPRNSSKP